jgi:hypothetical protein
MLIFDIFLLDSITLIPPPMPSGFKADDKFKDSWMTEFKLLMGLDGAWMNGGLADPTCVDMAQLATKLGEVHPVEDSEDIPICA